MVGVQVEIVRYVDDSQPGWVECLMMDAAGRQWSFVEKAPVVTTGYLDANSPYPLPGVIACQVIDHKRDGDRDLLTIDTTHPWGIEATTGETRFTISPEQLIHY